MVMSRQALIIAAVLILLGGGYFVLSRQMGSTQSPSQDAQKSDGNVFTSIKDALSKSVSLECSFKDEDNRQIKSWIKGGAIRADIASAKAEESASVIVKDRKVYFWNGKNGFMVEVADDKSQGANQQKEIMEDLEKYKDQCKPAVVADSQFTPPADVKFQDLSQMTKSIQPGTTPVPSQYQDLINQYSNQGQ